MSCKWYDFIYSPFFWVSVGSFLWLIFALLHCGEIEYVLIFLALGLFLLGFVIMGGFGVCREQKKSWRQNLT